MAKLRVQVVTAEREVLALDDVDMVVAPGSEGVVGILPRHAPLLTTLAPGSIRIKKNGEEDELSVGGGFLQVANDRVLVLADVAERADELDAAQAEAARQRAQQALDEAKRTGSTVQAEAARIALRQSMVRLGVVNRRRRGTRPGA
jgi:F-type H+-transporting ATPase subunit epsilon